jgi:hypothetical protein
MWHADLSHSTRAGPFYISAGGRWGRACTAWATVDQIWGCSALPWSMDLRGRAGMCAGSFLRSANCEVQFRCSKTGKHGQMGTNAAIQHLLDGSAIAAALFGTLGSLYAASALYEMALKQFTAAVTGGLAGAVTSGISRLPSSTFSGTGFSVRIAGPKESRARTATACGSCCGPPRWSVDRPRLPRLRLQRRS